MARRYRDESRLKRRSDFRRLMSASGPRTAAPIRDCHDRSPPIAAAPAHGWGGRNGRNFGSEEPLLDRVAGRLRVYDLSDLKSER